MAKASGSQFIGKKETCSSYKNKKINQAEIKNLHDRLVDYRKFFQFTFPIKYFPELRMEYGKAQGVQPAKKDDSLVSHLIVELEEMSKFIK